MDEALRKVKRAYQAKRRAEQAIRDAVLEAQDAGHSTPAIAKVADVSQPTIFELAKRARAEQTQSS